MDTSIESSEATDSASVFSQESSAKFRTCFKKSNLCLQTQVRTFSALSYNIPNVVHVYKNNTRPIKLKKNALLLAMCILKIYKQLLNETTVFNYFQLANSLLKFREISQTQILLNVNLILLPCLHQQNKSKSLYIPRK